MENIYQVITKISTLYGRYKRIDYDIREKIRNLKILNSEVIFYDKWWMSLRISNKIFKNGTNYTHIFDLKKIIIL